MSRPTGMTLSMCRRVANRMNIGSTASIPRTEYRISFSHHCFERRSVAGRNASKRSDVRSMKGRPNP